jgi:hypothetical protein
MALYLLEREREREREREVFEYIFFEYATL